MKSHRLAGDMDERSVLEGGIDLVRGQSVLRSEDDLSVPAEYGPRGIVAGQAEHRAAQDRVPKPQAVFPAVAGQKLTRRVESRVQAAVGRALEPCPANAGRGIPEVDLEICRPQSPEWRRPGSRRPTPGGAARIVRTTRPDSTSRIRHVRLLRVLIRDGDLEAVRRETPGLVRLPGQTGAGWDVRSPDRRSGPRHRDERRRSAGCPD